MKNIFKLFSFVTILFVPFTFVFAVSSPTVSIQSLSPGSIVKSGNAVYFIAVDSGFPGGVSYAVSDSQTSSLASTANINSSGNFTWVPTNSDVGVHNITVTASDSVGNRAIASVQVTVNVPAVIIQSLSPGSSVTAGSAVFFSVMATGFIDPKYFISDSAVPSSLQSTNINSTGGFSWITKNFDVGSHTIIVNVIDSTGSNISATQSITVNASASSSIQSLSPANATVSFGQPVSFAVVATGFTNPAFSLSDSFPSGTMNNVNLNSSGLFRWTPMTLDAGTHNLTINVQDSTGNHIVLTQTILVVNASMILQLATSSSSVTNVGIQFAFTATSTGLLGPWYTMTDSFYKSTISNANINSFGQFSWTPTNTDVGTHVITVNGRDAYGHTASASINMTVRGQGVTENGTKVMAQSDGNIGALVRERTHKFLKALSFGSRGNDVTELQKRLTAEGVYSGPITGYYGALTVASVKKYQGLYGIQKLGNVGPSTRSALNK